jgi:bisphosphoglycerate-dependent phosphoglycerate mutase
MNYNKTFTGWIDTDLSEVGKREVLMTTIFILHPIGMLS